MNKLNIEDICKVLEDEHDRRLQEKAAAERKAREEAERKKREEEERQRKAKAEAERKKREEEARRKAEAERARKAAEEARIAAEKARIQAFQKSVSRFKLGRGLGYLFWMAIVCAVCFTGVGAMEAADDGNSGTLAVVLFIFLCLHLNVVTKALKANGGMLGNEKELSQAKSLWYASFLGAAGFPLMVLACDKPAMVFGASILATIIRYFICKKKINFTGRLSQSEMKYVKFVSYIPLIVAIIAIFC